MSETDPRPSFACREPGCAVRVARDGECWTCPKHDAALRARVAELEGDLASETRWAKEYHDKFVVAERERDEALAEAARLREENRRLAELAIEAAELAIEAKRLLRGMDLFSGEGAEP